MEQIWYSVVCIRDNHFGDESTVKSLVSYTIYIACFDYHGIV